MKNHDVRNVKSGRGSSASLMDVSPQRSGRVSGIGQRGFTLVELLVISAILGLIMTIAIPSYTKFIGTVRLSKAVSEIATFERDIVAYQVDKNALPDSLNDIGRDALLDPWGRPYVYLKIVAPFTARNNALEDLNTDFDCYSKGVDGLTARLTNDAVSADDVVRGGDGAYYGLASSF